jgi:putative aldouronate transport system substrate-binding protein
MLRRFRDEDANGNGDRNDEIPFTSHNPDFAMLAIGGMYGVRSDLSYDRRYVSTIEKGKLHFQLADPEYRDALRAFAVLFREKLLDNDIFTHTDKDYFGKGAAGRVGFTPLYQPRNFATYAREYDAIVPPKGPKGHQIWNFLQVRVENNNTFSITRANKHPEATMRWIDWFYSEEGSTAIYLVRPNEFGSYGADGKFAFKKEIIEAPIGFEKYMGQHTIYPGGGAGGWFREAQMASGMAGTPMMFYVEKTKPYLISTIRPGLRSAEATDKEKQLRADLDVYITENMAKFAAGQLDAGNDAVWDNWVRTLDKLGLRELEAILQESISR